MTKPLTRSTFPFAATLAIGAAVAGVCLFVWFRLDPASGVALRVAGHDGTPPGQRGKERPVDLKGTLRQFDGVAATDLPGAWPRFRGAQFDNTRHDGPPLADQWPAEGPKILWSVELGEGHAAPVVLAGRVYVIDYDEEAKADAVRCFSLADGREIWRHSYKITIKRNHGMSRTIPAVTDKYLVAIGPRCHVVCLDPASGTFKWGLDLQRDYGTKEPLWYTGQCALIEGDRAILAPCGTDALMMAVECETGKPVWKTPNASKWDMSHSSIVPMTILGKKMYVYGAVGGLAGVSAEAVDAGTLLWQAPWNAKVIAPSPVQIADDKIFVAAGYGEGGMTLRVKAGGPETVFSAEILEKHAPKDGLASEQQTPILNDGLLYAVMPKDGGALRAQFVCYRPDGSLVWSSGQAERFGLGPYVLADGKIYILNDDGMLSMARASRDKFELLARTQVLHGQDAWGPIAVVGGRMLLRDSKQMVCIDVEHR